MKTLSLLFLRQAKLNKTLVVQVVKDNSLG